MDGNASRVILDNGSGYLKCGMSSENIPKCTIPALIGRPMLRYEESIEDFKIKPIMVGDEVIPVRSMLEITHPITEGIIENVDDMEILWRYGITNKLGVKEDEYKDKRCILTEAPLNPHKNKIIMAELMFDKMGMAGFNIEPQAKLSLICEGLDTGIVLDSGDGVTHCIPIYANCILHHHIKRSNIAGRHITSQLIRLLQLKGYAFNSSADFETVREVKEKFCFVSCDIKGDRKLDQETTYYNSYYKLPDKRVIQINKEKFEAPEILFNPSLIGNESEGAPDLVFSCINACDMDVRKSLYSSVVLSGATTMFPGFSSRLELDLKALYKKHILKGSDRETKFNIGIIDTPRRKFSVFIGACFLANFYKDNDPYWITKQEWEENGVKIIEQKCQNIIRY